MEKVKIMIIDDEIMAIEYLRGLIPWDSNGYEIVAEATDAIGALDLSDKLHPQIIIADICMPGIDGLEFCERVLSNDKSVKIILLSAFKEFDYAKKALEIGAFDYLLKREINCESLINELNRARKEIENESIKTGILKKQVLLNSIEGKAQPGKGDYGWDLLEVKGGTFILLLIKMDMPYPVFESQRKTIEFDFDSQVKTIYSKLPTGISLIESFELKNKTYAILLSSVGIYSQNILYSDIFTFSLLVQETFSKLTGETFTIVINKGDHKISNISKIYYEAANYLKYSVFIGKAKIVMPQEMNFPKNDKHWYSKIDEKIDRIEVNLKKSDIQKVIDEINSTFEENIIPDWDVTGLEKICNELVAMIRKVRRYNLLGSLSDINGCFSVPDIQNWFINTIRDTFESINKADYRNYSLKVQKTIYYLHTNYHEEVSLNQIANELEISEFYLSRIFKNETGKTILEYLTKHRMEKSKQLLENTNYKIYEIAEMVGYKTAQYFSQVFSKYTGLNPLEYRERNASNETQH